MQRPVLRPEIRDELPPVLLTELPEEVPDKLREELRRELPGELPDEFSSGVAIPDWRVAHGLTGAFEANDATLRLSRGTGPTLHNYWTGYWNASGN